MVGVIHNGIAKWSEEAYGIPEISARNAETGWKGSPIKLCQNNTKPLIARQRPTICLSDKQRNNPCIHEDKLWIRES